MAWDLKPSNFHNLFSKIPKGLYIRVLPKKNHFHLSLSLSRVLTSLPQKPIVFSLPYSPVTPLTNDTPSILTSLTNAGLPMFWAKSRPSFLHLPWSRVKAAPLVFELACIAVWHCDHCHPPLLASSKAFCQHITPRGPFSTVNSQSKQFSILVSPPTMAQAKTNQRHYRWWFFSSMQASFHCYRPILSLDA